MNIVYYSQLMAPPCPQEKEDPYPSKRLSVFERVDIHYLIESKKLQDQLFVPKEELTALCVKVHEALFSLEANTHQPLPLALLKLARYLDIISLDEEMFCHSFIKFRDLDHEEQQRFENVRDRIFSIINEPLSRSYDNIKKNPSTLANPKLIAFAEEVRVITKEQARFYLSFGNRHPMKGDTFEKGRFSINEINNSLVNSCKLPLYISIIDPTS